MQLLPAAGLLVPCFYWFSPFHPGIALWPAGNLRLRVSCRGQRYLLGYTARLPGWRAVLQRVPGLGGGGGGLALVLREDARPEDVLTGVLQVHWHWRLAQRNVLRAGSGMKFALCVEPGPAPCLSDRHVVPV